jgi:hypothetical protein
VCGNREVLRKIFGPKRDEITGTVGYCIMRNCANCAPKQLFWVLKSRKMGRTGHLTCQWEK